MFIEINDISTGTVITEPLNAYSINYVYNVEINGKYRLIYMLLNGLRKIEEFDSQSDLEDRIDEIKELSGGGGGTNVYTYKGSCTFENLPTSGQVAGDVWNITNDFELDGKPYPAGTNVAWDGTSWDALAGSVNISAISDAEIDALFGFKVLLGYSDIPTPVDEYNLCIASPSNLVFPSENFVAHDMSEAIQYVPLMPEFSIVAKYENLTATIPYNAIQIVVEGNNQLVGFFGNYMDQIYAATQGLSMGVEFTVHIPKNAVYINDIGNRERTVSFVYGGPIDGTPYPNV